MVDLFKGLITAIIAVAVIRMGAEVLFQTAGI